MTNYNERLDEILTLFEEFEACEEWHIHNSDDPLIEDTHSKSEWDKHKNFDKNEAKQALTSLTRELVVEAKPQEHIDVYTYSSAKTNGDIRKIALDHFEQNLLKALEQL